MQKSIHNHFIRASDLLSYIRLAFLHILVVFMEDVTKIALRYMINFTVVKRYQIEAV